MENIILSPIFKRLPDYNKNITVYFITKNLMNSKVTKQIRKKLMRKELSEYPDISIYHYYSDDLENYLSFFMQVEKFSYKYVLCMDDCLYHYIVHRSGEVTINVLYNELKEFTDINKTQLDYELKETIKSRIELELIKAYSIYGLKKYAAVERKVLLPNKENSIFNVKNLTDNDVIILKLKS